MAFVAVNENGFVVRAFFMGRRGKVIKLCRILGLGTGWTYLGRNKKRGQLSLGISEADKIVPEKLEEAKRVWDSDLI